MRASVRMTRHAISPRFAISTLSNISTVPDQHAHRRRGVAVAGGIELRAVGDEPDHVLLGAQLAVLSAGRDALFEGQLALGRDRHVPEEVDVAGEVALLERAMKLRLAPIRMFGLGVLLDREQEAV